jgi:hypothetical protein
MNKSLDVLLVACCMCGFFCSDLKNAACTTLGLCLFLFFGYGGHGIGKELDE